MIIVGAGHDNGVNDPLVLAASILATAINGAQRQHQQVSQVKKCIQEPFSPQNYNLQLQ